MSSQGFWTRWIHVLDDPNASVRGFSLAGLEFRTKLPDPVTDKMYGTLPGDNNTQNGKFWVVTEEELMRVCSEMQKFAQGKDWFFPVEFCNAFVRPQGVLPVPTRDATVSEREEALSLFENTIRKT